jgi:hypothetical protein
MRAQIIVFENESQAEQAAAHYTAIFPGSEVLGTPFKMARARPARLGRPAPLRPALLGWRVRLRRPVAALRAAAGLRSSHPDPCTVHSERSSWNPRSVTRASPAGALARR